MIWEQFMGSRKINLETFQKILLGEAPECLPDPFQPKTPAPEKAGEEAAEYTRERETLEELAKFRELIVELPPHTRNKSANRNYEFTLREVSTQAEDGKMTVNRKPAFVPYVAVRQPSQNEFGNPCEKMACFFIHAMHSETTVDGSETSLVFSNPTGSAQLLDLFFKKIGGKIELKRPLTDDGV
jgi:hypothetical protein